MLVIAGAVAAAIAAYGAGAGATYGYTKKKWVHDTWTACPCPSSCSRCNGLGHFCSGAVAVAWPLFWVFWILAVGPAVKAHALVSGAGKERPALPPAKVVKR